MEENTLHHEAGQEKDPSRDFEGMSDPFERDQQLLSTILNQFGLSEAEIAVYSYCRNIGEIEDVELFNALANSFENINEIIFHLMDKGFIQEIPSKKGMIEAIAPFAVIFNRIAQYENLLADIKEITPQLFQEKFAEIQKYAIQTTDLAQFQQIMDSLKEGMSEKLNEQQKIFDQTMALFTGHERLENALVQVKNQSGQLIKTQFNVLKKQFINLQVRILSNLEKLRLGVVTDVVKNIIQYTFKYELDNFESTFNKMFENNFRTITAGLEGEINQFEHNLQTIGNTLKETITNTQSHLSNGVDETQATLDKLSKNLFNLFEDLQNQFSGNVLTVFEDILGKFTDQITMGSNMMQHYWDSARKNRQYTVEDVWFVNSVEKMRIQMAESINRVKSKILIVAPRFEDIPLEAILKVPSRVHIRIECNLDLNDPQVKEQIPRILERGNVMIRHRNKIDLWAINRDFEELVIGILSPSKKKGASKWDLVAIGSIIPTHITIFEQIVEQAWIEGRKIQFDSNKKEVEIL
jgi:sugar-specific transcriptional regulator TrmB